MRTLTVKHTSSGVEDRFPAGWHTLTISKATYGAFQDSKYIDINFSEYPKDNIKCRIWAKNGEDGEEFAIGRLFRFANAGIKGVSKSDEGDAIITLDDSPAELISKKINVFFYKSDTGYTEVLGMVAPTEFSNDLEAYSANDIKYWKSKAEKYYRDYVAKDDNSLDNAVPVNGAGEHMESKIPF